MENSSDTRMKNKQQLIFHMKLTAPGGHFLSDTEIMIFNRS